MKKLILGILLLSTSMSYVWGQGGKRRSIVIDDRTTVINEEEQEPEDNGRTYKKNAFGLDLGVGKITDEGGLDQTAFDFGIRYMHYFTPYIGADFFKFQTNVGFGETYGINHYTVNPQLMTGIRGSSPRFAGDRMHAYATFKLGLGFTVFGIDAPQETEIYTGAGFCYEFEIGIHLTKTLFVGYVYNYQGGTITWDDIDVGVRNNYSAFRLGFNFGGNTSY
jgi:hypothetical protein